MSMEVTIDLSVIGSGSRQRAHQPEHRPIDMVNRLPQPIQMTNRTHPASVLRIIMNDVNTNGAAGKRMSPIHASTHCADIIRIIFQMTKNQIKMIRSETLNYTSDIKRMSIPTEKLFNENNNQRRGNNG